MINSFDIIIPYQWKTDPRLWALFENIFSVQFHLTSATQNDIKTDKSDWKIGNYKSLHPKVEKWLEVQNWWDLQLFRYVERLMFTRMGFAVNKEGFHQHRSYNDYLEYPEWSFDCDSKTVALEGEPPEYSEVHFPTDYKET
eukprot:UN15778